MNYDPTTPSPRPLAPQTDNRETQKQNLLRPRLLDHLSRQYQKYSILVLQGQTGQGKTILAQQFIKQKLQHHCIAQLKLNSDDQIPQHFLHHLHTQTQQALPYLQYHEDHHIAPDVQMEHFLHQLNQQLTDTLYLLLDDLYQLLDTPSETLLQQLLQQRPDNLQLILLSREQLHPRLNQTRPPSHWLVINNQQLAFNHDESKQLYAQQFEIYLSDSENQLLHQHTQGWPLGIQAYAQCRQEKEMDFQKLIQHLEKNHVFYDTFQEIFDQHTSPQLQLFLLKTSFLEKLTPDLANTITGDPETEQHLQKLLNQHLFIAPPLLGQDQHQFMPLWRNFLRQQATQKLTQTELTSLHHRVARHWHQHNNLSQALLYYLKAQSFQVIEPLLAKKGAQMLHLSHNNEIRCHLNQLHNADNLGPWLSLLVGSELSPLHPTKAQYHLLSAATQFQRQKNQIGGLLTRIQQIYFHLCIDGDRQQLQQQLTQAEALFQSTETDLMPYDRLYSASLLTLSHNVLHPDTPSKHELDQLIQISHSHKLHTLERHLHLCRLLEQMLKGELHLAKRDLEQLHQALIDQQGSALEQAIIFTTLAFYLSQTQPYVLLEQFLQQNNHRIDQQVIQNSLCAPLLQLWQAYAHLAEGQEERAIPALRQAIGLCQAEVHSPLHQHLNNLKKHLLHQNTQNYEPKSTVNRLLQAISQSAQKHESTAEADFSIAHQQALQQQNEWLLAGILMHWGKMLIESGQAERSLPMLQQLSTLKQGDKLSCLFMPNVAKTLVSYEIKQKADKNIYQQHAAQQLSLGFGKNGEAIPLLNIHSLGGLTLSFANTTPLHQSDITPKQQILLALLLASRELHLDQSTVLQALWPEASESNSRHKLDVMLSRFRSLFNKTFSPQNAGNYIGLKHGVLSLKNVDVDIHHFSKMGEQGLKLYKRGDHWQASLALQNAVQLWQGRFCPGIATLYSVADLRENLLTHYHRYCIALADIHERCQRYEEASELLLPIFNANPGDESLVASLYRLFSNMKQRHKAAQVLHSYREFLNQSGFDDNETISLVIGMRDKAREGMF